MTKLTLQRHGNLLPSSLYQSGIGFSSLFDDLFSNQQHMQSYPPYNIIQRGENAYAIELAVAGFAEGDIDINLSNNKLTISGSQQEEKTDAETEYVHRGISSREFIRSFTLADHVLVKQAAVKNGILTIDLEKEIPEEKKPRKIEIAYVK